MSPQVKLFTLYAQLQGGQLICNGVAFSVINPSNYRNGIKGYFVIEDLQPGFIILNYIPEK